MYMSMHMDMDMSHSVDRYPIDTSCQLIPPLVWCVRFIYLFIPLCP